jgi:hypothetical protein
MANGNGCTDEPDWQEELPPGLAAWFAIEECVGETIDALSALDDETDFALTFLSDVHRAVKGWVSWEMWAAILEPGQFTPDRLLVKVLEGGVDPQQQPRSSPATLPRPGLGTEWRAFCGGKDDE